MGKKIGSRNQGTLPGSLERASQTIWEKQGEAADKLTFIQRVLVFLLLEVLFDLHIQLPSKIPEFACFYSFFFTQPP